MPRGANGLKCELVPHITGEAAELTGAGVRSLLDEARLTIRATRGPEPRAVGSSLAAALLTRKPTRWVRTGWADCMETHTARPLLSNHA